MDIHKSVRIVRVRGNAAAEEEDTVAVEQRLDISVNGRPALSMFCTPRMIKELVVGIIHNEGLIEGEWCAERIAIAYGDSIIADVPAAGRVSDNRPTITSGCAGGVSLARRPPDNAIADPSVFSVSALFDVFRDFQQRSESYRLTAGVHSAALSDGKNILAFAEDIGRHNAVDKVIGFCLLDHTSFSGKIMLASGRLSSEIVTKCIRCGIPVVVSRAAPTSRAVELAAQAGLTLVGFMRGERMNIYTGRDRITLGDSLI